MKELSGIWAEKIQGMSGIWAELKCKKWAEFEWNRKFKHWTDETKNI